MSVNWQAITAPTVLINRSQAQRNIQTMQIKAQRAGVALRPHFKTHQSALIGTWFGTPAETPIAVSSLAMAQYFAASGWHDIHLAIPLNPREVPALNELAAQVRLTLTVEHLDAVPFLAALQHPIQVMVEIDTGYGRTGVHWQQAEQLHQLLLSLQALPHVQRLGLMVHSGQSYGAQGYQAIAAVHQESSLRLEQLLHELAWQGSPLWISTGDTPTCSQMEHFPHANEIRPGNYVFYDLQQHTIGACAWSDIALTLACPIIARYPERKEVVIHGGAVHFSKDWVQREQSTTPTLFGQVMQQTQSAWGDPILGAELIGLSQEHGKVRLPRALFDHYQLGDLLIITPAHSCLVMAAMGAAEGHFVVLD